MSATPEYATAAGAEARPEEDRRPADADGAASAAPDTGGPVEQRVDLLHPRLDRDKLGAPLHDEAGAEPVALVHLEREAPEIS